METKAEIDRRIEELKEQREQLDSMDGVGTDRPRGVLSDSDREFIFGESGLSRQARYNRKTAIEERIKNSVLDQAALRSAPDYEKLPEINVPDRAIDDAIAFLESLRD